MSSQEIGYEQSYVSMLYERLDALRERASRRLAEALRRTGGTPQARTERDADITRYSDQMAQFGAAENGLCFGRLDFTGGDYRYIGRLGIFDESAEYEPLLVDWRAPAARPFYLATAAAPDGVRRRRRIRTDDRTVTGVDDEVLDLAEAATRRPAGGGAPERAGTGIAAGLTGEAALLAAVNASRTGQMSDIVETIQAEQDEIIRCDHRGVLVVQGGPGTGKTAVALHRAAYLLYTYREQLAKRGVLILGPNPTFLRYIGQVLPSLGETGVVLSTIGDLFPGVSAGRAEPAQTAEVKGRPAMVEVLAAAVRDRQEVPADAVEIVTEDTHAGLAYQRETLRLDPEACVRARDLARRSGRRHNHARPIFVDAMIDAFARQVADRLGADVLGGENLLGAADVAEIGRELRGDAVVAAAIDRLWPILTPQRLLADLYASAERLAAAAPALTAEERAWLRRDPEGGWTVADVPLLDEAAELLGEDDQAAKELAERRRREREAFAQGVLDILSRDMEDDADPEILMAYDMLDAQRLAERQEGDDRLTVAELAAADRRWAYGHVIVDEAQELSAMAWRMVMRRCPSRSMTLVGDVAQTGDLAGASSWAGVLAPHLADRWRLARLTVNYRTPAEIMEAAADVVAGIAGAVEQPWSVRRTGVPPWRRRVRPDELATRAASVAAREAGEVGDGRVAVLATAGRLAELRAAVRSAITMSGGPEPDLGDPVTVLTVKQAKGLEFDSVLVVDPDRILAESPRGRNDLYVAMTRATQRLGVLHTGEPPAVLARLPEGES